MQLDPLTTRALLHKQQLAEEFSFRLGESKQKLPRILELGQGTPESLEVTFEPLLVPTREGISDEHLKTWRVIKDLDPALVIGDVTSPRILSIVQEFSRPSFLVQDDSTNFANRPRNAIIQETNYWQGRIGPVEPSLQAIYACVGRIELANHPLRYEWAGTGWMLTPEVVVTNRHVAVSFAELRGGRWAFQQNGTVNIGVSIDYREEHQSSASDEHPIGEVIHIEEGSDRPDVAFLRLRNPLPRIPLALAASVSEAEEVLTIGYPKFDSAMPEHPELLARIFGNIVNVKRAAPGVVLNVKSSQALVTHDCSTLGGNSGSAVVSLATAEVVGLHFGGRYMVANAAVSSDFLLRRGRELGLL